MLEWLDLDLAASIALYGYVTLLGGAVLALLAGFACDDPLRRDRWSVSATGLATLALASGVVPELAAALTVVPDASAAPVDSGRLLLQSLPPLLVLSLARHDWWALHEGDHQESVTAPDAPTTGKTRPRRHRRSQSGPRAVTQSAMTPTPLRDAAGWIADPIIPDSSAWPTLDAAPTPVPVEHGDHPRRRVVAMTGAGIAVIAGAVGALALERRRRKG